MKKDNEMIKKRIRSAIESSVPDVLPEVLQYMERNEGGHVDMVDISDYKEIAVKAENSSKKTNSKWMKRIASLAAAFILVFAIQTIYGHFTPQSIINFDVNPSIEMKVNRSEKVLSVNPLNDNAKEVIGDMKLKNIDLDIALNALIGSMVKNGYISSIKNSILISVDSNNRDNGIELQERLTKDINSLLNQYDVDGAVLSQNIAVDTNIKELAKKYNISMGKAALIQSFILLDDSLEFGDLANLSINDLNLLIRDKYNGLQGIKKLGEANDIYIGKEKAKEIALTHSKIKEEALRTMEIEIDYEKGRMIYEVEFKTDDTEYEYEIDAISGEIIEIEQETTKKASNKTDTIGKAEESAKSNSSSQIKYIGKTVAKNIALKHAGVNEKQISKLEIDLEKEDGIMVYEVEFYSANIKYEYEINAVTGKILDIEQKSKPKKKPTGTNDEPYIDTSTNQYIGVNAAKDIALAHAGLKTGDISKLEVELEKENGLMIYEVEFKYSGYEYEYEINAVTGKILEWERERD